MPNRNRNLTRLVLAILLAISTVLLGVIGGQAAQAASPASKDTGKTAAAFNFFTLRHGNKCVGTVNGSVEADATLEQQDCVPGRSSQQWRWEPLGAGEVYQLRHNASFMCLDFARPSNGVSAKIHACNFDTSERWHPRVDTSASGINVVSDNHNTAVTFCLDLEDGSPTNGARIQIIQCLFNSNQIWTAVPA
jgi:hypothetical protein